MQSFVKINTSIADCSSLEGSFTSELFVKRPANYNYNPDEAPWEQMDLPVL